MSENQTTNLIEEEVGTPGGAGCQNVGRHSSVETSDPLGPHDGGHGVPDVGISSTACPTIVHSKPREVNINIIFTSCYVCNEKLKDQNDLNCSDQIAGS